MQNDGRERPVGMPVECGHVLPFSVIFRFYSG